ncbi:MAG TPA: hypothetical protein VF538_19000 [Pyrinomonadaceae bacterium]|jgi:hypothetical protein
MRTNLLAGTLFLASLAGAAALPSTARAQGAAPTPTPAEMQSAEGRAAEAEFEADLSLARHLREIVRGSVAFEKATDEKHFFMGPSLSAPGGMMGDMGMHPVIFKSNLLKMNRPINQIDFGFNMAKGSARRADPNFFNMGINFRKIIPVHWKKAGRMLDLSRMIEDQVARARLDRRLDEGEAGTLGETLSSALKEIDPSKQDFMSALVVTPFSPRVEMNLRALRPGPVINFVNTTGLELRTNTRQAIHRSMFWSLKLTPLALESGATLRQRDLPALKGSGILRLNTAAEVRLALHFPCMTDLLANRIQFEAKAVNRHLFREESAFDRVRERYDARVRGNRSAFQVDAKYVFGFTTPIPHFRRHPALVVTYRNGFFPPSYIFNNAVTFHFVFESADSDNVGDISVR